MKKGDFILLSNKRVQPWAPRPSPGCLLLPRGPHHSMPHSVSVFRPGSRKAHIFSCVLKPYAIQAFFLFSDRPLMFAVWNHWCFLFVCFIFSSEDIVKLRSRWGRREGGRRAADLNSHRIPMEEKLVFLLGCYWPPGKEFFEVRNPIFLITVFPIPST